LYLIIIFSLFAAIAAFRAENVGNDTIEYVNLYRTIQLTNDISSLTWRYEIGFLYLNKLLGLFFADPQSILIAISIFTMFGYARFVYKYSKITWLSVYLFFTFRFFDMTMVVMRLSIAIVLILFAYDFLRERKLFKFLLVVMLASLFHRSALIFLISWPITKYKFNYKTILLAISSGLVLYIGFEYILNAIFKVLPMYEYYIDSAYLNGEIRIASILNLLVVICILCFGVITNYYKNDNPAIDNIIEVNSNLINSNKKLINDGQIMMLMLLISILLNFLSLKFNLLDRVNYYFQIFSIVYLPNAINSLKNRRLINIVIYAVMGMFFIYSISINIIRPDWSRIYPYKFFWEL
jgi:hypothetical protein